jgi:outer membrane lipoprotein-sorting protein
VGSDFTYADVSSPDIDEAAHRIVSEEQNDGGSTWVIESVPMPKSDSKYKKLISWIRKEDFVLQKVEFYDKKSKLLKVMTVQKIESVGGEILPLHFTMENVQKGSKTELSIDSIQLNQGIQDSEFGSKPLEQ